MYFDPLRPQRLLTGQLQEYLVSLPVRRRFAEKLSQIGNGVTFDADKAKCVGIYELVTICTETGWIAQAPKSFGRYYITRKGMEMIDNAWDDDEDE